MVSYFPIEFAKLVKVRGKRLLERTLNRLLKLLGGRAAIIRVTINLLIYCNTTNNGPYKHCI